MTVTRTPGGYLGSVYHLPSTVFLILVYRLPSIVYCLLFTVYFLYRLPSTGLASTVYCYPSTVYRQPSIVIVDRQPSTVTRLPSTVNRLLWLSPSSVWRRSPGRQLAAAGAGFAHVSSGELDGELGRQNGCSEKNGEDSTTMSLFPQEGGATGWTWRRQVTGRTNII